MTNYEKLEHDIESIVDSLKGICTQIGVANASGEERIITTVFLYKFLNDKFMFNLSQFSHETGIDYKDILENKNNELDAFYDAYSGSVAFEYKDTIEYLIQYASQQGFYKMFDAALENISNNPRNIAFNLETADGTRKPLFEGISKEAEESSRDNFAKSIFSELSRTKFDFSVAFENGSFDFYSRIFEYLIKDYNVASGRYAEYFTPQAVSEIIAKILVGMSEVVTASEIYDPSAGSGSLVLHLANELGKDKNISRAIVYTQDISQKSSRFLRINLLLNGLTDSLHNAIQGDTLVRPAHYAIEGDPQSGLKKFDYIVANPPFKLDFSSTRDVIDNLWSEYKDKEGNKRFFAGVPKIPNKKKEGMPIYLLFVQHILFSLKKEGKAAVVVPTGFIAAKAGIEYEIRKKITDNKWLRGVIIMPPNIFANTGTNVSVLFIDKTNKSDETILIDASNYGEKIKQGKNKKTVLRPNEIKEIYDTFINYLPKDKFSVKVSFTTIADKKYSWSAGQYFEHKLEFLDLSQEEFQTKIEQEKTTLKNSFEKTKKLGDDIIELMGKIKYEEND